MFIAFEGPDQTGKSTSALNLTNDGAHHYNATKAMHALNQKDIEGQPDLPIAYDRIDWFTHMVYRLALPEKDWADERPRTVFAMPDTHLVIRVHREDLSDFIAPEEVIETPIARVNPVYRHFYDSFSQLNRARGYSLFRTTSLIEVSNDTEAGTFSQQLIEFDSPILTMGDIWNFDFTDNYLLTVLREEERQRITV